MARRVQARRRGGPPADEWISAGAVRFNNNETVSVRLPEKRPNFNSNQGRQLGYSLDLFWSTSLTGETQHIPRATPVSILRREWNRVFIRADYDGRPYYGWVDTDDLRAA
jgi:hypothetical protein